MAPSASSEDLFRRPGARELIIKGLRVMRLNRPAARIYYRFFHRFDSADRDLPKVIDKCLRAANDSGLADEGDYFEFGVFKGYAFWCAYKVATELGIERMRFFGFDSFEGLPEVRGVDDIDNAPFYPGQFSWPLNRVKNELEKRNVDWNRTFLVKGYFDSTLTEETRSRFKMSKASVVLMDCDLYESTSIALEFLADMMMDGTILIMDDWYAFNGDPSRGEPLALSEFAERHPHWVAEPWFSYGLYGRTFVMRRREQSDVSDGY